MGVTGLAIEDGGGARDDEGEELGFDEGGCRGESVLKSEEAWAMVA
jgi:hypothetical protein